MLTILLWAGIIINVARVRQTKTSLWGISSAGRALAWHARGHRFDPGILHQSNAKRTQCHYSNGRQCVRFVLQTSTSCGRALAWHARGHRFDPGILHQSNAKRTQCHYSNGRQCVRFVLQTSTSCITHNKKARTFPLQSVRVFLCLYLVRGTKHRENQCVRFALQTSTSCITHNKKARTFPLQSVRVFLCLYLVRGTKHRENFAKIFRLFAGTPAAMPYKKITG